jgi:hypothetical protein
MKKVVFFFAFLFTSAFLSAQCTQAAAACCKNKSTASVASTEQAPKACAGMAMAQESSIQKRIDNTTGKITYYEKSVCSQSGTVSWNQISTDEANKKMTKVASAGMEKTATGEVKSTEMKCQAGAVKSCCKDKAKKEVN